MKIDDLKNAFLSQYNPKKLNAVALSRAISVSLQHNSLYSKNVTAEQKNLIHSAWTEFLKKAQIKYVSPRSEKDYLDDVLALKELMNDQLGIYFRKGVHPRYKSDPGFRVSHAQKSLSVFLKHLWCMGLIETPPQCPIDRKILQKAGVRYPETKWGYVNTLEEHSKKIQMLQKTKNDESWPLAEWELEQFSTL